MQNELIIRSPKLSDKDSILGLVTELNHHQGDPTDLFTIDHVIHDVFGDDRVFDTFVAELNTTIVGYVFFHAAYESGYAERGLFISDLYVTEASRRKGVARALIKAVGREAKSRGYTFLWWASKPWNTDAQEFYNEIGANSEPIIAHALTHDVFDKLLED